MDSNLRTPNSEPRTSFLRKNSFDEILSQLTRVGLPAHPVSPRKILFGGESAGEISSYVAGWLAGKGREVIVLDGANRFDPYMVSSFARKALIPPEKLLKRIRIARAFTCYQMATLMGERLGSFLKDEEERPWVIILGPVTTFLDEDVPAREVRPLFERSLGKLEEMVLRGIPFLLFQPSVSPKFPFTKGWHRRAEPDHGTGRVGGLVDSKKIYLMRRLLQFSNEVWRIDLDDQGPKMILEKGLGLNIIENRKLQNEKCKFIREDLPCLSADRKIF